MTKEEFKKLLDDHDWFFQMSDDLRVWGKGQIEQLEIEKLCKDNSEFDKMYKEYGMEMFHPNK